MITLYFSSFLPKIKSVECLDPVSLVWTQFVDMPEGLWHHSMLAYGNRLVILGGRSIPEKSEKSVWQIFPEETDPAWKALEPMKEEHPFTAAVELENEIYAIGGEPNKISMEIFDGKSWREGPQLEMNGDISNYWISAIVIPQSLANSLIDLIVYPNWRSICETM